MPSGSRVGPPCTRQRHDRHTSRARGPWIDSIRIWTLFYACRDTHRFESCFPGRHRTVKGFILVFCPFTRWSQAFRPRGRVRGCRAASEECRRPITKHGRGLGLRLGLESGPVIGRLIGGRGTARAVESSEKLSRGGRRGMEEHLGIRRIKQVNWARRGKSRGQRDAGLKSTTRHGANL